MEGSAASGVTLLPLSAHDPAALRALAKLHNDALYAAGDDGPPLVDLAHTLARRRSHHAERMAIVVDSRVVDGVPGFTSYATATYIDIRTLGEQSDQSCPDAPPPMDTGQTDRMGEVSDSSR